MKTDRAWKATTWGGGETSVGCLGLPLERPSSCLVPLLGLEQRQEGGQGKLGGWWWQKRRSHQVVRAELLQHSIVLVFIDLPLIVDPTQRQAEKES